MNIATNIKVLRERSGLSQSDFAKLLGVSDKAVSTWENGRREPRIGVIRKLSSAFNLSISDITDSDLEAYYKNKDSPTPEKSEAGEKLSIEEVINAFVKAGFVREGQDLTDADLRFIIAMGEAFSNWFESKQDSA